MVFGSLLPQGIVQAIVSFDQGYWHARTPELMHSTLMETLVWLRVPGDIVFALGAGLPGVLSGATRMGPSRISGTAGSRQGANALP